ncbi:MAG TPA: class I SAM-dependent methyltransferase [Planctomycetaceae bacterium]|jgi:SAM-dependent methyltransferase|nr:class I SAM-dependent methyltransferase [Planctomycetaceae bacterium]
MATQSETTQALRAANERLKLFKAPDDTVVGPSVLHWEAGTVCEDEAWEAAYERFETPEQEIRKFERRYRRLGLGAFSRSSQVVELFCGRANGLVALDRMGFRSIEGVDLSPALTARYRGPAQLFVGDCRQLRFESASKDLVIIQGGLHHLPSLPGDLERVFSEIHRILRPTGRVAIVEPWLTPFLRFVHAVSSSQTARRLWPKLDALASMNEREHVTYDAWLSQPQLIRRLLVEAFVPERQFERFGKLFFLGRPRPSETYA